MFKSKNETKTKNSSTQTKLVKLKIKNRFIESLRFLRFSFNSLSKSDFAFLTQKFDNNVLHLVKLKRFDPCEFMSDFQKFKEYF